MKSVVVLQSNYVPWKGYFDLIHDADQFIFYDDLQYTKRDWRSRNKIKAAGGSEWITIPAGSDTNRLICEVELKDATWQQKHWKTVAQNYRSCPHFERYRHFFEDFYLARPWSNLSEMNQYLIRSVSEEFLGIRTEFRDSREFSLSGQKQERLLEAVIKAGAERYISGPAAKSYIQPERFSEAGIDLVWKDYSGYPEYPQRFPPFEHGVSILDLLFNVGPDAPWYIWGWREGPLAA
ncbi:MAG: WbqC family protein [Nitrospira sp.]|nr:WbqC family protein [Nitrospira sp.]